jgi:hypothetical protein
MKKLIAVLAFTLLAPQFASAHWSMAIMLSSAMPNVEVANKLQASFDAQLKQIDKSNSAQVVYSPWSAGSSDYFYLATETYAGLHVIVNNISKNRTLYSNEYYGNAYRSENEMVDALANDFSQHAVPLMKACFK